MVEEDVRLTTRLLEVGKGAQARVVELSCDVFPGNAGVSLGVAFEAGLEGVHGPPYSSAARRAEASAKERPIAPHDDSAGHDDGRKQRDYQGNRKSVRHGTG